MRLPKTFEGTNVSDVRNATSAERFCEPWSDTNDPLVQTANFCFAVAFLVPHNFHRSVLLMRSIVSIGFVFVSVWSGLNICAPDILLWNVVFLVTNFFHIVHLAYKYFPTRIDPRLQDLYLKMFKSLRVKKKLFKELESKGKIISLYPGDQYALEGITPANELLSILLNGRMKVTYEEIHLHNVTPNQFIDSPEWEASTFDRDQIFQVTVTAIEKCVYFCWTRKSLEQIFKANPVLHSIINNLIGRDITNKLYSVNEQLHVFKKTSSRSSRCGSSTNSAALSWIQAAIPRSLSVDEVHTSRTGQVRSLNWKENRHHCIIGGGSRFQSCGSSPARWSKDPAHFAESKNIYRVRRHLSSNSRLPSKSVGPMKQSGRQAQVLLHVAFAKPV